MRTLSISTLLGEGSFSVLDEALMRLREVNMNGQWFVLWVFATLTVLTPAMLPPGTARAQDGSDDVSGDLVIVPQDLDVGQTTTAYAILVWPDDVEDHHFTARGDSCENAGGVSESATSSLIIKLTACRVGTSYVRLFVVETAAVIAEVESVISEPSQPTVTIHPVGSQKMRPRVPVQIKVRFSEAVTGFDHTDIVVTNGVVDRLLTEDGEDFLYEVSAAAIAEVTVDVGEGAAHSVHANLPNKAAQTLSLGMPYDDDKDDAINREEVLEAIGDYLFQGLVTRAEVVELISLFLFGPIPETDRCPQFHEDDYRDSDGLANIFVIPFKTIVEEAIEEELSKPEVADMLELEEGTDLTVRLYNEVLGDTLTSPVKLSDGLYQYSRIYVEFLFAEGLRKGEASVWMELSSSMRRCVVTGIDLLDFETFEPTNCPVIVPYHSESGYRYLRDRVILHPEIVEKIVEAIRWDLKNDPYTIERLEIEDTGEVTEVFIGNEGTGDYLTGPRYRLPDGREIYKNVHLWAGATFEDGSDVSFHVWAAPSDVRLKALPYSRQILSPSKHERGNIQLHQLRLG